MKISDSNQLDNTADYVSKNKKVDVLQANFQQYYRMAIDHHTKTGTTSHILLVIVGAILVLVGYDNEICRDPKHMVSVDVISAFLVFLIGVFGAVWAAKQIERYRYWESIAFSYQKEMKKLIPEFKTKHAYECRAEVHSSKAFGRFFLCVQDRYLWVILHLFVILLGVALFLIAICQPCDPGVLTNRAYA